MAVTIAPASAPYAIRVAGMCTPGITANGNAGGQSFAVGFLSGSVVGNMVGIPHGGGDRTYHIRIALV